MTCRTKAERDLARMEQAARATWQRVEQAYRQYDRAEKAVRKAKEAHALTLNRLAVSRARLARSKYRSRDDAR